MVQFCPRGWTNSYVFRGWTTEEDKKKKILQLPEVRAVVARMEEASDGSADSSSETVTGKQIDVDTFCDNGICSLGGSKCR